MAVVGKDYAQANQLAVVDVSTEADQHARAERRMHRGRRFVITGCVLSVVGVIAYSLAMLTAGAPLLNQQPPLVSSALAVIGLGTLLWLVGSFLYLDGALESDPDEPTDAF